MCFSEDPKLRQTSTVPGTSTFRPTCLYKHRCGKRSLQVPRCCQGMLRHSCCHLASTMPTPAAASSGGVQYYCGWLVWPPLPPLARLQSPRTPPRLATHIFVQHDSNLHPHCESFAWACLLLMVPLVPFLGGGFQSEQEEISPTLRHTHSSLPRTIPCLTNLPAGWLL